MVHSRVLNLVLVLVTIASILSTYVEASRGFGWSSNNTSGSGWGWGFNRNGSSWRQGGGSNYSSGSGGFGLGGVPNNTHNSGSNGSGWDSNQNGSSKGWGWGWGPNNTYNPGNGRSGSSSGGNSKCNNATYNGPRKIIVGGDKEWTYGFNYIEWASKTAPFFLNDVLVFKYNPPSPFTHSVYLLPNLKSFEKCDVKKGKMIASPKQGAGNGFEFVLKTMKTYYISCGEHEGAHCNNGTMKFTVTPIFPRW